MYKVNKTNAQIRVAAIKASIDNIERMLLEHIQIVSDSILDDATLDPAEIIAELGSEAKNILELGVDTKAYITNLYSKHGKNAPDLSHIKPKRSYSTNANGTAEVSVLKVYSVLNGVDTLESTEPTINKAILKRAELQAAGKSVRIDEVLKKSVTELNV